MANVHDRRIDSLGFRAPGVPQVCTPYETWCETSTNRLYKCNGRGTGASVIGYCVKDQPTITIGLDESSICQNETVVVSGYLKMATGVALANKYVTIRWGPSGDKSENYHSVITDANGHYTDTVTLPASQTYYFSAYYAGDNTYESSVTSSYVTCNVTTCQSSYDTVFSNVTFPANVILGNGCVVTGKLLTNDGLPVPGVQVVMNIEDPLVDMIYQKRITTDGYGGFAIALSPTDLYVAAVWKFYFVFSGATIGSAVYVSSGTGLFSVTVAGSCPDGIESGQCSSPGTCDPYAHPDGWCEGGRQYVCAQKIDCSYCAVDSGPCGSSEPKALSMTFVLGYEPPIEVAKGVPIELAVVLTDVEDSSVITNVALAVDRWDAETQSWVTVATLETGNVDCYCYPLSLATSAYSAGLHSFRVRSVVGTYNEVIINFDTEIVVTSVCTEGKKKCVDGYYSVCEDNAWMLSTEECDEETMSTTSKYIIAAGILGLAGVAVIAFTRGRG